MHERAALVRGADEQAKRDGLSDEDWITRPI